jgi:hypothetical protein
MKKLLLLVCAVSFYWGNAQSLISEKKILLTKDQRKNEPIGAFYESKSDGVLVYFESKKAKKEKGEKRTWERYEMTIDKNLEVKGGDYNTLGTKFAIRPRLYFSDYRIGYTSWVDEEGKTDIMMVQIIKFDLNNKILEVKDYEISPEKAFKNYRVITAGDKILIMAQFESKGTGDKGKSDKGMDYVKFITVNALNLEVESSNELNLLGKNEFGIEDLMFYNNKIYMVGIELQIIKPFKWKFPKNYILFRLAIDGKEEARQNLALDSKFRMAGGQLAINGENLCVAGEYALTSTKQVAPKTPASNKTVKVSNPYVGIFMMQFDLNSLKNKAINTYDYEKDIMKKLRKGNAGFNKKGGSFVMNDFIFLADGSFYLTTEMFVKYFNTTVVKTDYFTTWYYYTYFDYMDAVIYKFSPKADLDWLVQIDRDTYRRKYRGHLSAEKPLINGKLDTYLMDNENLVALYNTPGRKYSEKRFGLSGITMTKDGKVNEPVDFTSDFQFGLLEDGLIQIDRTTVIGVGTDKKEDNLWLKKIKLNN